MPLSDRKFLCECLESFSDCTETPVALYTPEGEQLASFRADDMFCRFFNPATRADQECVQTRVFSGQLAFDMGEPYIYYCPAGLTCIAVPVLENGRYVACAVAGPMIMGSGDMDSRVLDQAISLEPERAGQLVELAMFTAKMRHYPPSQIQKLSTLLYSTVLFSRKDRGDYAQQNARHKQQLAIGEQIRLRKQHSAFSSGAEVGLGEMQQAYVDALRSQNAQEALEVMRLIIDELILRDGGNFDTIKMRLLELFLQLTRTATESGVPLRQIFSSDLDILATLNAVDTVERLAEWSRTFTCFFAKEIFAGISPLSSVTSKAVSYLSEHYMEKITLRELASRLFVSDSYLSKLFRQELNTSFTDYLNKLRIDHSIDLMQSTDFSLLEIAGLVGFEDQSYFTKVFKRITGQTPRRFKASAEEEI